jgi:uncharacterized protein
MSIGDKNEGIYRQLRNLQFWQAAAFCACCAERLLPMYARFSSESGWGDPQLLRSTLDYCWDVVAGDLPRFFGPIVT